MNNDGNGPAKAGGKFWRLFFIIVMVALLAGAGYVWYGVWQMRDKPIPGLKQEIEKSRIPITFTVWNADTAKPVPGAVLQYSFGKAVSDAKGTVRLRMDPTGKQEVKITAKGYESATVQVDPEKNKSFGLGIYEPALQWPMFGSGPEHDQTNPKVEIKPPYKLLWKKDLIRLLEFPATVVDGKVYIGNNPGSMFAMNARTGQILWWVKTGGEIADSPAYFDGLVLIGELNGTFHALDATNGKEVWKFRSGGGIESSPVVVGSDVVFGSKDGFVYCLDAETGRPKWRFDTGADVKGSPAVANGIVYAGNYGGRVYALRLADGGKIWSTYASVTLYSSPAVVNGVLYIGSTAGTMHALSAKSGRSLWTYSVGSYIYSSPAVHDGKVYFGSYNGRFYCLSAKSGRRLWTYDFKASISGSPAVVSGVVFLAGFARRTVGLDAQTGRLVWSFPDGRYTPVSAAGNKLFVAGEHILYCFTGSGRR